MAILRNKSQHYTVVDKAITKGSGLSLKAIGLLVLMLSLPDDWDFSEAGLCAICNDGLASVRSGLKELQEAGYLHRKQVRANGRFQAWEWEVSDTPKCEKPISEKPKVEKPKSVSQHNRILNNKKRPPQKDSWKSVETVS